MSDSKRDTSTKPERGMWSFQERVSSLLFNWNAANIAVGLITGVRGGFWGGFGSQAVGWGLINWIIAAAGSHFGCKRRDSLPDPDSPEIFKKEQTNLRNILWVNWGLDVLYMWGGWRFLRGAKPTGSVQAGTAVGIMVQGLLLFIFDSLMLREVVDVKPVVQPQKKADDGEAVDDAAPH
jgi:hypothetical protein